MKIPLIIGALALVLPLAVPVAAFATEVDATLTRNPPPQRVVVVHPAARVKLVVVVPQNGCITRTTDVWVNDRHVERTVRVCHEA